MADPYRRGKLTRHGWRVAYHLARTVKSRKLELPETLPHCLYPPGYVPVVAPPTGGKGGATDKKEARHESQAQAVSDDKKGGDAVVDGATAAKGDEAAPAAAAAADPGVVDAAEREGQEKGKAREGEQGGRVPESDTEASKRAKKDKKTDADHEENAAKGSKKRRSTRDKVAAAAAATSSASAPVNVQPARDEPDDEAAEYRMSESQQAQYNKIYDKQTKGKPGKIIDSKQVR